METKQLILVGAGEAHLHLIQKMKNDPLENVEVTLISPTAFQPLSATFSDYVEGLVREEETAVNIETFTRDANVQWIKGAVMSVAAEQKAVLTDEGKILPYDVLSFNIGTLTADLHVPGVSENTHRVKPYYRYYDVIEQGIEADRVVVVGSSLEAVELSLTLQARRRKEGQKTPVTLLSREGVLPKENDKVRKTMTQILNEKKVHLIDDQQVKRVQRNALRTSEAVIPFDELIWLEGKKPHELFQISKLPVDAAGFLKVEQTLQVKQHPAIFGVGACTSYMRNVTHDDMRQGEHLYDNIKAFLQDGYGTLYERPKRHWTLIATGQQEAFFAYHNYIFHGRHAWWLKRWLTKRLRKRL